jgi:putative hemolysin
LQSRIYCLGTRLELPKVFFTPLSRVEGQTAPLAEPIPAEAIASEIEKLHFGNLIASQGDFDIYVATAAEIPESLKEIGRLRELTFRAVGEGTGKARDLDEYDVYYRQLILWNRKDKRVAGGYRMGLGDEIFARYGPDGFYVSSLFKVKPCFHPVMQKAVELGRSYVVPDYQRQRLPLFLLWKGILHFLLQNPHYRYLYGPVSISKYYSNISRSLIVAFIEKHYFNHELAACLKPRKPFRFKPDKVDVDLLTEGLSDNIQSLDNLIETIEPEHIRLPVLVRQYLKLNARFISFNVDPNFSDVLDGFIILDLQDVPVEMIEALKREGQ